MSLAPIGVSTYLRLRHLKQTIEALKANILAKESDLYIFSDAARPGDEGGVDAVRKYIDSIKGFKKVHVIKRIENSRKKNSRDGIDRLLDKYGKCIYLEEDIVTAQGFLKFMNESLNIYEKDKRIFSITGYSPPIVIPVDYCGDVFILRRASGWGFGIWHDRYKEISYLDNDEVLDRFSTNKEVEELSKYGEDLLNMILLDAAGKMDALDVKIFYYQFLNEKYTIYPRKSLVRNIGLDGSGIHCGKTNKFDVGLWDKYEFKINGNVKLDDRIIKSNYRFRNFGKVREDVRNLKSLKGKNKSEMDKLGEGLIFIISQPRAGSTLLQRILSSHPEIHTTAEPWIMLHPIYALKRNGLDAEYESSMARQGLDDFLMQVPEGEELYIEALREMANVLYNKMINVSGKKYFLDKTPRYYFIIPELYRVFPKAKFIFLMRNPVAVLSSVLKTWCGNILQNLVNRPIHTDLIKGPHYLLEGIKELKEDAIVVHYEKLVQNPKEVIQYVCNRIGIQFNKNMLEYGKHPAPEGRFGDSVGVHKHISPVSEYIDKWTENLASSDLIEFAQKYLLDLGPEVILHMGYSYQNIKDKLEPKKLLYKESKGGIKESSELNQQGEDFFAKDNFDGALDAFTKALDIDQNNATTHNNLGVLYYNRGDKEKAFSHYKKAAELQPENITFQKNLADFYYVEMGRIEDAMRIYVKVLNANPEDVETLLIIGHICVTLKKFDDAKDFYSRILIIEPWNKDAKQFLEELEKCQMSVADDRLGSEDIETTSKEYLVSAIVSTYNSERFIRGCLEDLENQTIADRLEIIVVNSGSEQNEDKIIKEFQEKYSNIEYIKTEQRETIYQAWNRGVKSATGTYITNANTDDRHRKDAFELLVKVLDENQDVALVYADQVITEKENETLKKCTQAGIFFWPDFDRNYLLKVCSVGSQPMWRKSVHEEFGYFDESMHIAGDYEFWLRITQKYSLKHLPELLGLYYRSSQNAEYRNHQRTMQETALVQSYYKTKLILNEPQVQGNPLVSVIIPTYNRSQQLETALKSVAIQSYENIEAVVINDGGEDVSAVIGKFKGELEIQYITHKQNKDRAAARNTGLKKARGEYIAYLDDDDIFHNDHIETALRALTNSDSKIVYSDAFRTHQKNIDGNYQIVRKDIPYSIDYQPGIFLKTNITPTTCIIHEKSVIDEVGNFDESLPVLEDWDLWIRISQKYEFYHIKKVTCEFTWRDDGSTTTSAKIDQFAKYRQRITERYQKKTSSQKEKDQCPPVSLIILTFNALQYTKKCVRSIQQHTVYPYEIIFVDNSSSDGTAKYLRKIVSKHDNFSLIENKENKGFAAGNNQGMTVAEGNYILLMNNDVVVTPGWLERMVSCAEKSPDIGMVGPVSNYVSGPQLIDDVKYNTSSLVGLNEFALKRAEKYSGRSRRILRVVGFCMLIKRAVVDKIGGLDSRYGLGNFEDDDFSLRAALAGFGSCIAEDCFIHHFGNRTFIGAKIDYRDSLHKNWEIFKEKWGLPQELSYGSPYNVMQISKGGFIPEKHYCPLNGRDFRWKDEQRSTSFEPNAAEKIYINEIQPLINEGKHEKATIALEELIALYPKFSLGYNDLGVLYFNKGEKEKALSHYQKAAQLQPENVTYQKNLADFYYVEQGSIEDALKLYNRALCINPEDTEILLIMGHICVSLKKFEDAKVFYDKVLQIDPLNEDARQILNKLLNNGQAKNPDAQVSIILPTSGQQKYIKKCVESIQKYTSQLHEIIFVDNGATKGTRKWLNQNIKENSNFIITKCSENAGSAEIINEGIKASTGEYILSLANDVVVTKGWLSGMLECLQSTPDAGIVGPMSNVSRGLQKVSTAENVSTDQLDEFAKSFMNKNRNRRISTFSIDGFCMLFRRSLVEEIGLFDKEFGEGGYEDEDFCIRALLEGRNNLIAGDVYVHQQNKKGFFRNKKYFNSKWNKADAQSPLGKKFLTLKAIEKGCDVCQRGHIDNAVEILLEGIGLSPDDKRPYYVLAEILLNAKIYKDAIDVLNEMPQDENDLRRLELIGYCKEGMGLDKEAINITDQILVVDSNSATALNLKGILAFKQGDIKLADYFNKAIESDPGYGEPYTSLGAILWDSQQEEALDLFEKGFILSPTITDSVTNYHSAIISSGEFNRAGQVFKEACSLYPNNKMIRYQLIDILIKQKKHAEAMHQIEKAITLYGVDDGILSAALKIRDLLGSIEIDKTKDKKYTVSLCMIVKNEEECLARCLKSVKPVVDEMIVIDTGSEDRTIEIARAFGAKVYNFKWTGDFSEARNFSISKASGNWTFHIDADEVISPLDYEGFEKIIRKSAIERIAFLINTRNYTMDVNQVGWIANDGCYELEESAIGWTPSEKVRLFRNESNILFEYPIHEVVEPSLKRAGYALKKCNIPVHHYGKLNKEKSDGKREVYYQTGRKKLDETGGDVAAIRELAIQAEILGKHDEAIDLWERFITIEPNDAKAYINMGIAYCGLGNFEEVIETAIKAMKLEPDMKESHYNYALGKLHLGSAGEAVSVLEKLLERLDEYPTANFLLSAAYCCDGKKDKGINELKKLQKSSIGPGIPIRCHELAKGLVSSHRHDYAIMLLEAATESKNSNKEIDELYSQCLNWIDTDKRTGTSD